MTTAELDLEIVSDDPDEAGDMKAALQVLTNSLAQAFEDGDIHLSPDEQVALEELADEVGVHEPVYESLKAGQ